MRTITRIYRAGVPRVSVVELDCGHKTTHETALIKRWQWFIGKTGMVCPTCNRADARSESVVADPPAPIVTEEQLIQAVEAAVEAALAGGVGEDWILEAVEKLCYDDEGNQ